MIDELKILCSVIFLTFFSVYWISLGAREIQAYDSKQYYVLAVDEIVECCCCKSCYADSRSANLRKYAKMMADKVEFIENNRDELINKMMDEQIERKEYKVRYFINCQFFANRKIT